MYDFEAILYQVQGQRSDKVEWTHEHAPISVSIASNVPDFQDPHCIVDSNADDLVKGMVEYMECFAEKVKGLTGERWGLV